MATDQTDIAPPAQPRLPRPDDEINIGGIRYKIPSLALTAMVVAVLLPAAQYSINLRDPTPAQLLVAICIGVFSSVLCLWILDAVNILPFRSPTVSRTIYGAAIVSILGTGVGVFQGAFADRKWTYEGEWTMRVLSVENNAYVIDHKLVLIHSESADVYWGYSTSSFPTSQQTHRAVSAEVVEFIPEDGKISVRMLMPDQKTLAVQQTVSSENKGKRFISKGSEAKYKITLARPR